MAIKNKKFIKEIKIDIENISPLHIGASNGDVLLNTEENLTTIPGTTLAGAFKAYLFSIGYENLDKLFGGNSISKVFVYDSFAKLKGMETRPNVKINNELGVEENKFERDYVGSGHKFSLKLEVYADSKDEFLNFERAIYSCILAINNGDITLGSYKSTGAGLFKVIDIKESNIDLLNKKDLFQYLKRENKFVAKDLNSLKKLQLASNDITFILDGTLETPLLIKGEGVMDAKRPDGEQIRNVNGDYIIPGSSLKGVIRSQGEKILEFHGKSEYKNQIFGSDDSKKKIASKLKCFDTIITEAKDGVYHRIKVDKLTGGVKNSALFDDKPVLGKVKLQSKFSIKDDKLKNISLAVIALVYRDIATGKLSLGGGNNIGRGRIKADKLLIKKGDEVLYSYNFKNNKLEEDKLENCFKTLGGTN